MPATLAGPQSSLYAPFPLQRTLEELFVKGPQANTRDNPEVHQASEGWFICLPAVCACLSVSSSSIPSSLCCSPPPSTHLPPALRCPPRLPAYPQESLAEQQEVLHAWHAWVLRELGHFKSKFRGAAASLLGAGDCRGFSLGERTELGGSLLPRLPPVA